MDKYIIRSLQEFLDILKKLKTCFRYKDNLFFRGIADNSWSLLPGIYRYTYDFKCNGWTHMYSFSEYEMLESFIKEASVFISDVPEDDIFKWMQYAQHYGVPTRLLDFTTNPLIALYFCCKERNMNDGALWILNESLYLDWLINKGYSLQFNSEEINKALKDQLIGKVSNDLKELIPYPIPFVPAYIDERMNAQSSRFLIWGLQSTALEALIETKAIDDIKNIGEYFSQMKTLDYYDLIEEYFLFELTIPCDCKIKILNQLDSLNINEKHSFPWARWNRKIC